LKVTEGLAQRFEWDAKTTHAGPKTRRQLPLIVCGNGKRFTEGPNVASDWTPLATRPTAEFLLAAH